MSLLLTTLETHQTFSHPPMVSSVVFRTEIILGLRINLSVHKVNKAVLFGLKTSSQTLDLKFLLAVSIKGSTCVKYLINVEEELFLMVGIVW